MGKALSVLLGGSGGSPLARRRGAPLVRGPAALPGGVLTSLSSLMVERDEPVGALETRAQGVSLNVLRELVAELSEQGVRGAAGLSTGEVCASVIVELTSSRGCSLVELVRPSERGAVTHFISHPWANPFLVTAHAVIEETERWERASGRRAFLWMDVFAINQHKMTKQQYSQEDIHRILHEAVSACETMYACLYPWNDPVYLRRAWCLFETYTVMSNKQEQEGAEGQVGAPGEGAPGAGGSAAAPVLGISQKGKGMAAQRAVARGDFLKFILAPESREQFEREALSSEFDKILQCLSDLDVRRAEAFKKEDKEMILSKIEASYGGAAGLNATVALQLRRWLVQTATAVVARRRETGNLHDAAYSQILVNYGRLLADQAEAFHSGENAQALLLFKEALSVDRALLGLAESGGALPAGAATERLAVARDHFMVGSCLYWQRRFAEALVAFEEARAVYALAHGGSEDNADVARCLTQMGPTLMKLERWDEAESSLRRAAPNQGKNSAEQAETLSFLAYILSKRAGGSEEELRARTAEASKLRRQVLEMNLARLGEEHPTVAMSFFQLARSEAEAEHPAEASAHYRKATDIYRKLYGSDHEKTRKMEKRYISSAAVAAAATRKPSLHQSVLTRLSNHRSSKGKTGAPGAPAPGAPAPGAPPDAGSAAASSTTASSTRRSVPSPAKRGLDQQQRLQQQGPSRADLMVGFLGSSSRQLIAARTHADSDEDP
jgi:tetratricopeptide (TPR) repeat protein